MCADFFILLFTTTSITDRIKTVMKNKKTKSCKSTISNKGIVCGTGKKYLKDGNAGDPLFGDDAIAKDFENSINNPA